MSDKFQLKFGNSFTGPVLLFQVDIGDASYMWCTIYIISLQSDERLWHLNFADVRISE